MVAPKSDRYRRNDLRAIRDVRVTLRLPQDEHIALERLSLELGISRNALLTLAVKRLLGGGRSYRPRDTD